MDSLFLINPTIMDEHMVSAVQRLFSGMQDQPRMNQKAYLHQQENQLARQTPLFQFMNPDQESDKLGARIKFLEQSSETMRENIDYSDFSITAEINRITYITPGIVHKQIEICRNIKVLLDQGMTYGAYSLWRNLYEMDVVYWALTFPVIKNKNFDLTNELASRYRDYAKIDRAITEQIGINLKGYQFNHLSPDKKKIYLEADEVLDTYNNDFAPEDEKLIKPYDWSLPLFNKSDKRKMVPRFTPNFYNLVEKSRISTEFFYRLYDDYVKSSGYIHSSFLSTKFTDSDSAIRYIRNNTINVLTDFINRILIMPYAILEGYYKICHVDTSKDETVVKSEFWFREYARLVRKHMEVTDHG